MSYTGLFCTIHNCAILHSHEFWYNSEGNREYKLNFCSRMQLGLVLCSSRCSCQQKNITIVIISLKYISSKKLNMPILSIDTKGCATNPCQNGGTCTDGFDFYTCQCAAGYGGQNCQQCKYNQLTLSVRGYSYIL